MSHIELFSKLLLTLLIATLGGIGLRLLRVPGGMILGSAFTALVFNIFTPFGYMPKVSKQLAQVLAGAYIGSSLSAKDVKNTKRHVKPTLFLIGGHILINLIVGTLLYSFSSFDVVTCYSSLIPGGLSEIPLVAEEMGGNPSIVLIIQFLRIIFSLALFPLVASKLHYQVDDSVLNDWQYSKRRTHKQAFVTAIVAVCGSIIFKVLGFPAGILVGAIVSTLIFQLKTSNAWMPKQIRWFSQVLAGAYIGCLITTETVALMKETAGILVLSALLYLGGCFIMAFLLTKFFKVSPRVACLAGMPAGANDVAMIASDLGVGLAEVAFYQISRIILAVVGFPLLINFLVIIGFPFF